MKDRRAHGGDFKWPLRYADHKSGTLWEYVETDLVAEDCSRIRLDAVNALEAIGLFVLRRRTTSRSSYVSKRIPRSTSCAAQDWHGRALLIIQFDQVERSNGSFCREPTFAVSAPYGR